MLRYKLTIEYDGSNYAGWQAQKNSVQTVQGQIQNALHNLSANDDNFFSELICAGRTDAGVHALGQVAHFDAASQKYSESQIASAINFFLRQQQDNIVITNCKIVHNNFHARFDAKSRRYRYQIFNRKLPCPLKKSYYWHVWEKLDEHLMQSACSKLLGERDFSSFRAADCQSNSPFRNILDASIFRSNDDIYFEIEANAFLYHMVRNIIGTLKLVGTHKISILQFEDIINAQNRSFAGPTAPPNGLIFCEASY